MCRHGATSICTDRISNTNICKVHPVLSLDVRDQAKDGLLLGDEYLGTANHVGWIDHIIGTESVWALLGYQQLYWDWHVILEVVVIDHQHLGLGDSLFYIKELRCTVGFRCVGDIAGEQKLVFIGAILSIPTRLARY